MVVICDGSERRRTRRHDVYLPVRIFLKEKLLALGRVLNINCHGIKLGFKLEVTFKTVSDTGKIDEMLSTQKLKLEVGNMTSEIHVKTQMQVKWSECLLDEGEKIYVAGIDLQLDGAQQKKWRKFVESL